MASQFQNRVVGAIVLVAIGVIVLPSIFDGQKQSRETQFTSIPLIEPQAKEEGDHSDRFSADQSLNQLIDDIGEGQPSVTGKGNTSPDTTVDTLANTVVTSPEVTPVQPQVTAPPITPEPPTPVEPVTPKQPVTPPVEQPPKVEPPQKIEPAKEAQTPRGQAYVIQLGALKNASKVEQIKAKLSFANYTVFTIPNTPVNGQTTRIMVGPDASKQKLVNLLPELEALTGLKGVVKEHKVTR